MDTAIVAFTRDLRVHDNPALVAAGSQAEHVVPAFVADPALAGLSPNRTRFLADSVADLRQSLRDRGGDLVIRDGDPVAELIRLASETGAQAICIADDVSRYATRRRDRLARECARHRLELTVTPGLTVLPPGQLTPASGDHYQVFTPYWRAWSAAAWRRHLPAPRAVRLPAGLRTGSLPHAGKAESPGLAPGGESEGRKLAKRWLAGGLAGYPDHHDDLAGDRTSRLAAYLRFGCVSPLALATAARDQPGGGEFCRQLAWRDFYHQVTAAFPDMARRDYKPRDGRWQHAQDALEAWQAGRTGVPIVDAGMRQLAAEGFMHNRARMVTASFLTRNLMIDWRHGYRHFFRLLADGDVANNGGNWQWVAGTGNDRRPNRVMNPLRQASRFDPDGEYVRRYVPELDGVDRKHLHTPWTLEPAERRRLDYPAPVLDLG